MTFPYTQRHAGGFHDLPTQDTAIDKTFLNAVESALIALMNDTPGADEVPVYDNATGKFLAAKIGRSNLIAGFKQTVSTLAGGPPGSPSDGDVWIATDVDSNGTRWQFQYNSGSASTYKWEFIGGAPVLAAVDAAEATASGAFADLATVGPSITVARAGDYLTEHGYLAVNTTGGATNWQSVVFKNAAAMSGGAWATFLQSGTLGWTVSVSYAQKLTGLAAADVLKVKYLSSNGVSVTFQYRWIKITPVRII